MPGKLMPAFLAVTNIEVDNPRKIAVNAERVLLGAAARRALLLGGRSPHDARAEAGTARHAAVPQDARQLPREGGPRGAARRRGLRARRSAGREVVEHARLAGRLAKADLTTDMVREFTELQGTMGGIYAREEGLPEAVWKAIYFHYLPVGVEATQPPTREQLGAAAVTWAAVSLADKLDSVVGAVLRRGAADRHA